MLVDKSRQRPPVEVAQETSASSNKSPLGDEQEKHAEDVERKG